MSKKTPALEGKTALITGAGRGIGKAIVLEFAKEGADLGLVSRTRLELEATAKEVNTLGRKAISISADVSEMKQVHRAVESTVTEFGKIDILVNCAGIVGPIGPAEETNPQEWIRTISVNLIGVYFYCRAVLPIMTHQGHGKIINLSGGGATLPYPRFSAYATSKSAVVGFTQTLAEEVKSKNIQVNAIAPGRINTKMQDEIIAAGDAAGKTALVNAETTKRDGGTNLLLPASLAVFLASDASRGLTGRLLSAPWDNWKGLYDEQFLNTVQNSELFTLKRIDGIFFSPTKKKRQP